jgi:molecular chaperone GrpE
MEDKENIENLEEKDENLQQEVNSQEQQEHCECEGECDCECEDEECHCKEDHAHHKKHKHHHCECEDDECDCHNNEAGQYLLMAQRLQADFDNYRKHVAEQLDWQKEEGKRSVIEVFLPCLDTFKEAKKSITDENVLSGVNMIENKIISALKSLNVEKIETIGQKYNHNLHEVIAVMKDETKEDDTILEEYQAGYTFGGKVIRYSKVVVNKLG